MANYTEKLGPQITNCIGTSSSRETFNRRYLARVSRNLEQNTTVEHSTAATACTVLTVEALLAGLLSALRILQGLRTLSDDGVVGLLKRWLAGNWTDGDITITVNCVRAAHVRFSAPTAAESVVIIFACRSVLEILDEDKLIPRSKVAA